MELSLAKCESILDTLPIGYYTGRRIGIELSKNEETSYYSPMDDKIVVSYPIIAQRMSAIADGACDEEEAVRSMLYHEVSHAILTPTESLNPTFAVNVFEDERIETVLRNYYHGVDFRKQLYDVHGGKVPTAKDADSAFFNAVRFGLGTAKVQNEISRMLKEFASINRNTQHYSGTPCTYDYKQAIRALYRMVADEWASDPDEFNAPQNGNDESKESGESGEMKEIDSIKQGEKNDGNNEEKQGKGQPDEGQDEENGNSEQNQPIPSELNESIRKMVGAALSTNPNLDSAEVEKLAEFQKTVEMIIGNFNKKNKGGSGINAYSGVFNPRAVARQDYRFFERAMTTNGNNKFGTCHLNLIIDCSGSFCGNVPIVNGILAVLSELERKNKNFSMDVGFINEEFHLCQTVRERKMVACGGNDVPSNMKEILLKLQKPQTCNYNIILFDGDAICNYNPSHAEKCKLFRAFDMKQTTLITDPDNEAYMNPKFSSTKVVVTQNYTEELIDHIIHALTIAFG